MKLTHQVKFLGPRRKIMFKGLKLLTLTSFFAFLIRRTTGTTALTITNADELINISENVNSGSTYYGTTIFLSEDLDFEGKTFNPIGGQSSGRSFHGSFDGKGYTIKNLVMKSDYSHGGFIGFSFGTVIKNLVIDSSCSFYSTGDHKTLGIIGNIQTNFPSSIMNVVNMANMTHNGPNSLFTLIGGLTGIVYLTNYDYTIKNCVNYGTVTDQSSTTQWSEIGGLLGDCHQMNSNKCLIQNSINYGEVRQKDGSASFVGIGGLVGICNGVCQIENCVNFGSTSYSAGTGYMGGIAGFIDDSTSILTYNYWSADGPNRLFGVTRDKFSTITNCSEFNPRTYILGEAIRIGDYTGTSLIDALNAGVKYHELLDYSPWVLNRNGKIVTSAVDGRDVTSLVSPLLLLPNFVSDKEQMFYGWYTDNGCSMPYTDIETVSDIKVFGKMCKNTDNYTIHFETRTSEKIKSINGTFGSSVVLPFPKNRDSCSFQWWENVYGNKFSGSFIIVAHNVTLYAVWACTLIDSAEDLISLGKIAEWDERNYYNGKTVYLNADIDFTDLSGEFRPIKNGNPFTLDGRGHVISNLTIVASLQYVGMFWMSSRMTIRNLVFDETSSVISSYQFTDDIAIGMVAGYLDESIVENIVNMGTISNTHAASSLYIGTIIGIAKGNPSIVRECVNYGSLANSGSFNNAYIGGIVGSYGPSSSSSLAMYNCANYGPIFQLRENGGARIGGIVGITNNLEVIDSCISGGSITSLGRSASIGTIIGYASSVITLAYCKWTSDTGNYSGSGNSKNAILSNTNISSLNASDIAELNNRSLENGWKQWIVIHLEGGHLNNMFQESLLTTQSRMPNLVKEGCSFAGYYKDPLFNETFNNLEMDNVTDVYARWAYTITYIFDNGTELRKILPHNSFFEHPEGNNKEGYTLKSWCPDDGSECTSTRVPPRNITFKGVWEINSYALTFDIANGTKIRESIHFNKSIEYPKILKREGYAFTRWTPSPERMPANDITLVAQWAPNKYVVTFNLNEGEISINSSMIVIFGDAYGELPTPKKAGFIFVGWLIEKNEMITNESIVKVASDHILYAAWEEIPSEKVEIIFGTKDLSKEEVREILKPYISVEYEIIKFENSGPDEIRVIIEFTDVEHAERFVRDIREVIGRDVLLIKRVVFNFDPDTDSSIIIHPIVFLTIFT